MKDKSLYICVINAKKSLFGWLQRLVTGLDATHSMPLLHCEFYNETVGLSADKVCTIEFLSDLQKNKDIDVWIWEIPVDCDVYDIEERFVRENWNKDYGFLQILYFIPRRIAELLRIDVRRWWNPFKAGRLCSEICYNYLMKFNLPKNFINELQEWKPDNIHSGDIKYLMDKYGKPLEYFWKNNEQGRQKID